ncbi:chloride channel protein [Albirhodobacter sp. R86504]|jgi:H+/Cl- antiporter ClcA|uniref:chloride channel protein n=1 Tax=Albirhodobacter sp. R86504 TaxID=3093848 RepID=UPI00366B5892
MATVRRSRALMRSPRLWKSRLVFWIGALAIGAISAGFALAADEAQHFFMRITTGSGRAWLPLLITPIGFVLLAWAAIRWFPGAQGSGIPQAIAARHIGIKGDLSKLLSLKLAVGKIVMTVFGMGCGASIGREGPTVQVAAAIMLQSASLGGMKHARGLILAGSAAGVSAAFNTPLAGIVFAIEELSRSYHVRSNGVVLSAVVIAGVSSLWLFGSYTYFGVTDVQVTFPDNGILVLACGLLGGLLGGWFSRWTIALTRQFRRWRAADPLRRSLLIAFGAGVISAVIGVAYGGATFGTGYEQAHSVIEGDAAPVTLFIAKLIATLAATVSGIPGGLFAPSLTVGASLGSSIGVLLNEDIAMAALLGMAGYFAGVTQAPMTAFVIIFEMTGNHDNVVPIMAAAMLGHGVSRFVAPEPLYHALSRLFIADALRQKRAAEAQARETEANQGAAPPAPPATS